MVVTLNTLSVNSSSIIELATIIFSVSLLLCYLGNYSYLKALQKNLL